MKSDAEKQAAGLAGTLRAYQAIQRFDPTAQYPVLDNLLSLEKQGKLRAVRRAAVGLQGQLDFSRNLNQGASIAPFLLARGTIIAPPGRATMRYSFTAIADTEVPHAANPYFSICSTPTPARPTK